MLDITIISVGKLKESYWREAAAEYLKRLKPYCKVDFIELIEVQFKSVTERKTVLAKEGESINKVIPKDSYIVALDRVGQHYTSESWSSKLEEWSKFGQKLVFIIGGPLGLSYEILNKAQTMISLSPMSFTHQMTRIILLEQIYRGVTIQKGVTYHY